ncbi:hypothetical protein HDV01_004141 [Terramyces sp. JEL0728]|nr:hypothetical protein HDV01_004141 [Terramyces sp. JEL0728]
MTSAHVPNVVRSVSPAQFGRTLSAETLRNFSQLIEKMTEEYDLSLGSRSSTSIDLNSIKQEFTEIELHKKSDYRTTRLKFAIGFCFFLFVVQLVGGYISNSLALIADAFHMLSDVIGYVISLTSIYFATKGKTRKYPFGYKRMEVLGALSSIGLLWVLTLGLVFEAYDRLQNPQDINGKNMLIMAIGGVVVNGILIFVFGHDEDDVSEAPRSPTKDTDEEANLVKITEGIAEHTQTDINIRAAMLHAIGDLLCSVGVLISAAVVYFKPECRWVDPLCTFVFAVIAIFTTLSILKDIFIVLMQGTPTTINIDDLKLQLGQIDGVSQVIELQVWSLTMRDLVGSAELRINSEMKITDLGRAIDGAKSVFESFGVEQSTIQLC